MTATPRAIVRLACLSALVASGVACGDDTPAGTRSDDGSLEVRAAWAAATPPGVTEASIYLVVHPAAGADDHLVGAQSDRCMSIVAHETATDDAQVTSMVEVDPSQVAVRAGADLVLEPHGVHLMCTGLATPLVAGETWRVALGFEHAGTVTVEVEVRPAV